MRFLFSLFHTGINDHFRSGLRTPRWLLRFVWSRPRLYAWYAKKRHGIDIYGTHYDLVIDGFPRSGNSFCGQMVAASQGPELKLFTLYHCVPLLLAAVERGFPVCLILRNPIDAIISWVIFRKLPVDIVIKLYIDFYKILYPFRTKFLVLNFTTITGDFSVVLQLINHRFNLNLRVPASFEEVEKEAFGRIDRYYQGQVGGFDPTKVARPHPKRDEMKDSVRRELLSPQHARLLAECEELYAAFDLEAQGSLRNLAAAEARTP